MTFAEWIDFEARRIVEIGSTVSPDEREGYMEVQIIGALKKAYFHGKDGLTELDPPRAVR